MAFYFSHSTRRSKNRSVMEFWKMCSFNEFPLFGYQFLVKSTRRGAGSKYISTVNGFVLFTLTEIYMYAHELYELIRLPASSCDSHDNTKSQSRRTMPFHKKQVVIIVFNTQCVKSNNSQKIVSFCVISTSVM